MDFTISFGREYQPPKGNLEFETSQIFYYFFKNRPLFYNVHKSALNGLKRTLQHDSYHQVLRRLPFENNQDIKFICNIADDIFSDEEINWGKILGLISFSELTAQNLRRRGKKNKAITLKRIVFSYLSLRQNWIIERCNEQPYTPSSQEALIFKIFGSSVLICIGVGILTSLWITK